MIISFYNFTFEYGTGIIAFDNLLMGGIIRCAAIHFVVIVMAIFVVLYIGTIVSDFITIEIYLYLVFTNIRTTFCFDRLYFFIDLRIMIRIAMRLPFATISIWSFASVVSLRCILIRIGHHCDAHAYCEDSCVGDRGTCRNRCCGSRSTRENSSSAGDSTSADNCSCSSYDSSCSCYERCCICGG